MRRAVILLVLLSAPLSASAQTGVSADRVSLPEGPGSLEGIGANVDVNPGMGMMSWSVPMPLPMGYAGATPSLSLSYSSGGGASVAGMGWSFAMPSIERMTARRLPRYALADDFVVGGGEQLVLLPGTSPPQYRARFEGGFVRYTWMDAGTGREGWWLAEYPDGSKGYFGATAQGQAVASARAAGTAGTFRYMLVETVDVWGHAVRYGYTADGKTPLLSTIRYVFDAQGNPTYQVNLTYEDRQDTGGADLVSDGSPGFELVLSKRLSRVEILSRGTRTKHWVLTYEPYADAGGFTRLTRVEHFGRDGARFPVVFDFTYSRTLTGVCSGTACARPFVVATEEGLGVNFTSQRTTLLDINGDALPDVLDTTDSGAHRFFLNIPSADGKSRIQTTARLSTVGTGSSHLLGTANVHVLDANGDGFTDMINAGTGHILINKGNGDWEDDEASNQADALVSAFASDFDPVDRQLQALRFLDYNNDRAIDLIRSTLSSTTVYRNEGANGFVTDDTVATIGAGFEDANNEMDDMNGDGLLDVVRIQTGSIRYRLNLGWGQWADWVDITGLPLEDGERHLAVLNYRL